MDILEEIESVKVKLGSNKEVTITPWKAKSKKAFIKLFDDGKDVRGTELVDVLIRPNIDKPDIFLSPDEAQYLLIKIKEISVGTEIAFGMTCDNEECGKEFDVDLTFDDVIKYTPNSYPSKGDIFVWRDIPTQKIYDDIMRKNPDEPFDDIELILHIDEFNGEPSTSFGSMQEKIDNLSLKSTDYMEDEYIKVRSNLDLSAIIKCPHCDYSDDYEFDLIPNFFTELLPN